MRALYARPRNSVAAPAMLYLEDSTHSLAAEQDVAGHRVRRGDTPRGPKPAQPLGGAHEVAHVCAATGCKVSRHQESHKRVTKPFVESAQP